MFLLLAFATGINAQNYQIEQKEIKKEVTKPKKYEIDIFFPQIKGLNNNSQDGFNNLMKKRMNAEVDSFVVWMKDWEVFNHMKDMGSYYDINDTVLFMDSKLVSTIFYVDTYFESAAHPNNWSYSINYDPEKNKEIMLSDLFTGDYVKKISDYCIDDITKQKKRDYAPELTGPDEMTLDGAGPKEENFKVFNFTKEGFLITFPTYQVGAYVEGPKEVLIPYNYLKDNVKKGSLYESFIK
jgi:Protein of unknown function (DUF3298)